LGILDDSDQEQETFRLCLTEPWNRKEIRAFQVDEPYVFGGDSIVNVGP